MKPEDFESLTAEHIPGANKSKAKAAKLRSFLISSRFITPGSQKLSKDRVLNIFMALVCSEIVFPMVDFARLGTIHVISLSRHWKEQDVQLGSEVSLHMFNVIVHV